MGLYIQIAIVLFLFTGCSNHDTPTVKDANPSAVSSAKIISDFQTQTERKNSVPGIILPSPYQNISIFGDEKITFTAENTNFRQLLYSISQTSGLNLIIDQDIDTDIPITMSIQESPVEEVLNILMDISGCYYVIQENILHVKQFMNKSFEIPYVHSTTSFQSELGGDILNSAQSQGASGSGGMKGDFKLKYDNPIKANDFYAQIEENLKSLISSDGKYTMNRFSGVLTVYDRKNNVNAIKNMIDLIKKHSNQQVLIEAKIMEVVLNDDHSFGISWDAIANNVLDSGDVLSIGQALGLSGAVTATMKYNTKNFSAVISALDQAGNVDTLSNPRITVLNGQSALISSGKLVPFWEKEVLTNQGTGGSASNTEVTYTRRDVLNGITMGVTPIIMEDGKIMLNIIPITSSIEDVVNNYDENGKLVATAPILNIKEAGTVIYAKNNDLVLIGGLINNAISKKEDKVPLLADIPYLGTLFTRTIKTDEKRELVILLKLSVVSQ